MVICAGDVRCSVTGCDVAGRSGAADGDSVNMRRREVLMIGAKTFPPEIGGIETHVYEVATRLVKRGYRVKVLVSGTTVRPSEETVDGVYVARMGCIHSRHLRKISAIPFIALELLRNRNCIVHAHDAVGGAVAAVLANKRRFVYTMHGLAFHESDWPSPFREGILLMRRMALNRASHTFFTDAITAEIVKYGRERMDILSSGVDSQSFSKDLLRRPSEYESGAFTVLFVGRFIKAKGVETLLEAIALIPEGNRRQMRFVFVGDGPLSKRVARSADTLGSIVLLGTIDHASIRPYFTYANAFVLPSKTEGVPISLLEAMASGVPSIASDVGGIKSQFDRESLILISPEDASGLAKAIIRLHENKDEAEALGERGREFVVRSFSWDRVLDKICEVYDNLSHT